jgi:hypothetical protein
MVKLSSPSRFPAPAANAFVLSHILAIAGSMVWASNVLARVGVDSLFFSDMIFLRKLQRSDHKLVLASVVNPMLRAKSTGK